MPHPLPRRPDPERAGRILLLLLLLAYAAIALGHLGGLRWDSDEGINLAKAWLVADGFGLYREVWADQPPGYTLLLGRAFAAFGPSLAIARGLSVLLCLAGPLGVALGARELLLARGAGRGAAWIGALAGALALMLAPNFWWASRAAMIGLPAFSSAALAMGLALGYARRGGSLLLAAAALALGFSLWLKLQMIYLGLPLGLLVLWRRRGALGIGRSRGAGGHGDLATAARDLGILATGSLGPLLLSALVYGPSRFVSQVLGTYLDTRSEYPVDWSDNLATLATWLRADNAGLALLALAGAWILIRRPDAGGSLALAWTALTVLTAMQHAPLWIKDHLEPLLLALCTLAGLAAGWLAKALASPRWRDRRVGADATDRETLGPALLGLAAWLIWLPHVLTVDATLGRARGYDNDGRIVRPDSPEWLAEQDREDELRAAADYLRLRSDPGDFVATDYQLVAFLAGRRVAPELAAFSSRAVAVGAFSSAQLIEATRRRDLPVVLMWDAEIAGFSDYVDYLEDPERSGFRSDIDLGHDRRAWARADRIERGRETGPVFGSVARLLGHALARRGDRLELRLFWLALEHSDRHLSVFAHLYDEAGERHGQHDGTPAGGGMPTTEWPVRGLVIDRHPIEIQPGAPDGLRIHVGLYDPESLERLPLRVDGRPVPGDALVLPEPIRGRAKTAAGDTVIAREAP